MTDFSVLTRPTWLAEQYRRIILISHRSHLDALDPLDHDQLVVSTCWLAWRRALAAKAHAVHFEFPLGEWPEERGDPATTHIRACRWSQVDGHDMTLFRGVSLGKQFVRDVTLFCNAAERTVAALDRLCTAFSPDEVVLYGLRTEYDLLDPPSKRLLAAEVAQRHGARLVDRLHEPPRGDPGYSERIDDYGAPPEEPGLRQLLRNAYSLGIDMICRVRRLFDRRGQVLILHNFATVQALLKFQVASDRVVPALFAAHMPKTIAFVGDILARGFSLVHVPKGRLDAADQQSLATIKASLQQAWATPASGVEAALRTFLQQRIIDTGWLEQRAADIKGHMALLSGGRFRRVLVGDITNRSCRTLADVARLAGTPVDELLNGMFLAPQVCDARSGDGDASPSIDRLLSWGEGNERWLELSGASLPTVRTGYPAVDMQRAEMRPLTRIDHALVLPIYADCDDAPALFGNIFTWMVETIRALKAAGCAHIRVKLHSGPQNLPYYRDILAECGLADTEMVKGGPLDDHLAWADLVVGPVNSGAFVETLAAGKPYYPIRPEPSLIDWRLLPQEAIVTTAEQLTAMIRNRQTPELKEWLETWCSVTQIPNASRQVWQALDD